MVRTLRLAFARRRVLDHNGGVIDEKYLAAAGDWALGRHGRVKPPFVAEAFVAVELLAGRLEATAHAEADAEMPTPPAPAV